MSLSEALKQIAAVPFPQLDLVKTRPVLDCITNATTEVGITKEIARLQPDEQDVLMKAIYVGLGNDSKNSTIYFRWHAQLYNDAGAGTIVRTLNDKPPMEGIY